MKKQVLGGMLVCLGAATALLARVIGFDLDIFYVVISAAGVGLFLYGTLQKSRHGSTGGDPVAPNQEGYQ